MRYRIYENPRAVELRIEEPRNRQGYTEVIIEYPDSMAGASVESACQCIVLAISGYENGIAAASSFLKALFAYMAFSRSDLPKPDHANLFVQDFFTFYLTDTVHSKAGITTRQATWKFAESVFQIMKDSDLIPQNTLIPSSRIRAQSSEVAGEVETPLGYRSSLANSDIDVSDEYLMDITYALEQDDYFQSIEDALEIRSAAVHLCCTEYWQWMENANKAGLSLLDSDIARATTVMLLEKGEYFRISDLASGRTGSWTSEHAELMLLAILNHYLFVDQKLEALSLPAINKLSSFKDEPLSRPDFELLIGRLKNLTPGNFSDLFLPHEVLGKLLGILSARDCAAAVGIIIHEHPKFTAQGLADAFLFDAQGFSYHEVQGSGAETFSIDKKRAKERKYATLTKLSSAVLHRVIANTSALRSCGEHYSRHLFLTVTNHGIGVPKNLLVAMNISGLSLFDLYSSRLAALDLSKNDLTASKIRTTRGILKWLATGSTVAMAKELGNTQRSVFRNYIPKWLLKKWNERAQRNFQQLLVVLSSINDTWLLQATDFVDPQDLESFIMKVIKSATAGDVVSKAVIDRLGTKARIGSSTQVDVQNLAINLGEKTLAVLYGFSDWAETQSEMSTTGSVLVELANLFKQICDSNQKEASELTVSSFLQGDSISQLRAMHIEAQASCAQYERYIVTSRQIECSGK